MTDEPKPATAYVLVEVEYDPQATTPDVIADTVEKFLDTVTSTDGIWPDECFSPRLGSPGLGQVRSLYRPDNLWADDPEYPKEDWQREVVNGDTIAGYHDWIQAQREAKERT